MKFIEIEQLNGVVAPVKYLLATSRILSVHQYKDGAKLVVKMPSRTFPEDIYISQPYEEVRVLLLNGR